MLALSFIVTGGILWFSEQLYSIFCTDCNVLSALQIDVSNSWQNGNCQKIAILSGLEQKEVGG